MSLSRKEIEKMENIYESMYFEDMNSASVVGGSSEIQEIPIENEDSYAKGDTRIPTVLGVQRRNKIKPLFDPAKHQKNKKNGKIKKKI